MPIRKLRLNSSDFEEVLQLSQDAVDEWNHLTKQQLRTYKDVVLTQHLYFDRNLTYVLEGECTGEILGVVVIDGNKLKWICAYASSFGIGSELLEFAEANGATTLHVLDGNDRAVRFYIRNGWRVTKVDSGQDKHDPKSITMEKNHDS